jgi:flagellar biosynthesis GTPase FlhF
MEENKTTVTEGQENAAGNAQEDTKAPEAKAPEQPEANMQDIMNEMAKLKRMYDKASSEAAEFKKKYRESLSESEKASMEKAEKEAAREEEFNKLVRENNINRLEKQYLKLGYTADEAERMAIAEADNDQELKIKIMSEVDGRKQKEFEEKFYASRPNVNVGGGTGVSISKEQFDAMNPVELTKLKRENPAEYDRLMAM